MTDADPVPGNYEVYRRDADGIASVYSCPEHLHATYVFMMKTGTPVGYRPADPARHGCKGHMENWPVSEIGAFPFHADSPV